MAPDAAGAGEEVPLRDVRLRNARVYPWPGEEAGPLGLEAPPGEGGGE